MIIVFLCMIYYKIPLHIQKVYKYLGHQVRRFSEFRTGVQQNIFSIPMHPYLTKQNQDRIIKVLNNV